MPVATAHPLRALSLARTSLSDPAALPPGEDLAVPSLRHSFVEPVHPGAIDYAVAQIDVALAGLYFEPFDDPACEASLTLAHVVQLVSYVIEGLEEVHGFEEAVTSLREAVAHLSEARATLSSDRS